MISTDFSTYANQIYHRKPNISNWEVENTTKLNVVGSDKRMRKLSYTKFNLQKC